MGQYYTPVIKNEKGDFEGFRSFDYGSGLKLMEHSYLGNQFVESVVNYILTKEKPVNLAWVGDYAEPKDVSNSNAKDFIKFENKFGSENVSYTQAEKVGPMCNSGQLIFLNLDKKEYVDMNKYVELVSCDNWGCKIHPLPLLTAIGNGKGGGDYRGSNKEIIGYWACDKILILTWLGDKYQDFKDITKDLHFKE